MDELLKKLNGIDIELDALLTDDELTAEQRAMHDRLVAERTKVQAKIKAEQDRQIREEERTRLAAEEASRNATIETARRHNAANGRRTSRDNPGAGSSNTVPATPIAAADPNCGFARPRDFLTAVMTASLGGPVDSRLEPLRQNLTAGSDEQRGNYDPAGGYLTPVGFLPNLLVVRPEDDPMGQYVTRIPMDRPTVDIPARTDKNHTTSVAGGFTVTRRPQTVAGTSSTTQMEMVRLQAHSLFGLAFATEEILSDSPIAFAAIIERGFQDQFPYQLINERLNGTGTGEFEGVINAPATISVSKEAGQAAATIIYENLLQMRSRCWGYQKAIWISNHDTIPSLMLVNQSVGTGGVPIWVQAGGGRLDVPDLLLGRPIFFTEYTQPLGTVGDLVLGCWPEYLEGTYEPMQNAMSMHVRFERHERAFKFWMRNDGRCWWKTALTPKNSTKTLSPFVTLATRA